MPQDRIEIPIFYGTYSDLTRIDLNFMNGKIVTYKGRHFRDYIKKMVHDDQFLWCYNSATSDLKERHFYVDNSIKKYAIVPIDFEKPFLTEHWQHFHQMLLSIYPSDFSLIEILYFNLSKEKYTSGGKAFFSLSQSGEGMFDNFMFIDGKELRFVRTYLNNYFFSSLQLNYVKYILGTYMNSYREANPIYQYLSLIICLEATIEGNEQLSYRLKRNVALICGSSVRTCRKIFDNVGQLYKLRSAIVHGNINPSYKNFKEYHDYLKTLVGRLIRELIIHNISNLQLLNEKVTELGYGQGHLISQNYSPSEYPFLENIRLTYKAIQKY